MIRVGATMDESHISDGDTMVASVESRAINMATEYYEKRGYAVTNVCRARHEHKGYDLLVSETMQL
ncbi:hypothetical protein [Tunturiibacter gelidiferens]|uniref:hypothetical protein n=1 Tax=Tunturiibacter gelidiferens TaxID=3069689 RepID=UPI003D9BD19C